MFSKRIINRAFPILAIIAMPVSPLSAQTQPAKTTPSSAPETTIVVQGQKEKKVCKTFEAPTGSRVGDRRVCRTMTEWRLAEQTAQRNMDRENRRFDAERSQLENEKNGWATPRPH